MVRMVRDNEPREQLIAEVVALRSRVQQLEELRTPANEASDRPSVKRQATEASSASALETSADGIFGVDADGQITFFNQAAAEATGWPADDALGKRAAQVIACANSSDGDPIIRVLASGNTEHIERLLVLRRDGSETALRLSVAPLRDGGRISGAVVTCHLSADLGGPAKAASQASGAIDGLLGIITAAVSGANFEEQARAVLDQLLVAVDADRAVLVIADASAIQRDSLVGSLVIEVPDGGSSPSAMGPMGFPKQPRKVQADEISEDDLSVPKLGDDGINSLVALPVKVGGRVVGMLTAASSRSSHFDPPRIQLISGVLDIISSLHERIELGMANKRLSEKGNLSRSVARLLADSGGFDEKASRLLKLVSASNTENAAFGVIDESTGNLSWLVGAAAERGEQTSAGAIKESIAAMPLRHGTTSVINDIAGETDQVVAAVDPAARSIIAMAIRPAGGPAGGPPSVMIVTSKEPGAFPDERVELLSAAADGLSGLFHAARLKREINDGLDREHQRLSAVQAAAAQLAITESPDQALQHLVDAARELVGTRFGGVAIWNRQQKVTTLISSGLSEDDSNAPESGTLRVTELLGLVHLTLVQEKKRVVRVNESSVEPGLAGDTPLIRSLLGVPFQSKGGSTGAFFLADKNPGQSFTSDDEHLLNLFSAMATVLLDNLRLYSTAERQRRTLSSIQSSMAEGLIVLDSDGQVMFGNTAASELLGTEQSELQGKSRRAALLRRENDFDPPSAIHKLANWLSDPRPGTQDLVIVNPAYRDLTVALFPIEVSATEQLTGLLIRDVTEERELHRRRDTFVSIASHELRTPMTTVMGFTELLMSRDAPQRRAGWLRHIYEDSKRVVDIIDDLLNVSRIQSGNLSLDLQPVDLWVLLSNTAESLGNTASNHQLVINVPEDLPDVIADEGKLAQVSVNLLSNAIKYSPNGGDVTISATHDSVGGRVIFSVADNGVGIAQEGQGRLFTSFHRIQQPQTQNIRGPGLGLSIVKGLVELMGGRVWLESELNRGSTFYISLPVAQSDGPESNPQG